MSDVEAPRPRPLRGLVARVGELVVAPRAGLARVEREGGGFSDALSLVAAGAVAFRFPAFVEAVMGLADPSVDSLLRLLGVFAREAQGAAVVVLVAAVVVTALAGATRDASRDFELGAACYAPYFAGSAIVRGFEAAAGRPLFPALAGWIAGGAFALVALSRAVGVARGRTPAAPAAAPSTEPLLPLPAPRAGAVSAGLVVLALAAVGLVGNGAWAARHGSTLRPLLHGETAPEFRLRRGDGKPGTLALSELRGRVVVLDFWATWCPPCLAMMPTMHDLDREWKDRGVSLVGVNSDGNIDPDVLQEFGLSHGITYPIVVDDGAVGNLYKVRSLPTMIVVGKDGAIRRTFLGMTTKASIARALEEAVAAPN
jgi:thiol-disulfide isomerase/thioredoxin